MQKCFSFWKKKNTHYYKNDILHADGVPVISEIDKLLKNIDKSLLENSSIRSQISYRKSKIKDLVDIKSNESGDINVKANGKKIKIQESTFRILIQKEINELFESLKNDLVAIEEFNQKFK